MDRWTLEQPEILLRQLTDATKTLGELVQESVVPLLEDLHDKLETLQEQVNELSRNRNKKCAQRFPVKEFRKLKTGTEAAPSKKDPGLKSRIEPPSVKD